MLTQPLLALDYGSRRIGVAVSDELALFAHPRSALKGGGGKLSSHARNRVPLEDPPVG